jgi:hypothetical protein
MVVLFLLVQLVIALAVVGVLVVLELILQRLVSVEPVE